MRIFEAVKRESNARNEVDFRVIHLGPPAESGLALQNAYLSEGRLHLTRRGVLSYREKKNKKARKQESKKKKEKSFVRP
tara:strand:+ start:155 stop:391 length:237 start_codon:yes stop_codon:yes gene_type:complete